jgi:NADH-quinone oxidoreductase subunit A
MEMILFLDNSLIKKEYTIILIYLIFAIILTVDYRCILSEAKQNPESEKLSAYECGFEPYEDTRHVLTLGFAILFIIFDIEIMFFNSMVCFYF